MSLHKSLADFFFHVIPQTAMTDWQVVEGHQSYASHPPRSPGDGQTTSPSDLAPPGHSRNKPTGVPRHCFHGDEVTGWPRRRLTPLWSATQRL